ncbi:putative metalloprotease CJM1_0395 family protein [Roseibium aggregatum]|uniref:SprA family protein n=1 Tax=Roseibium aggregatum TaxID=187304 RepID=A0A926P2I9_9HYPH|nr:putative metalloprotease CJM1_0395 family protein [Roseibium aggregatum]MBD1548360.1 hypothetical protein [Roseibium aggregatum]
MIGALLSSSAARSLAASRYAGFGSNDTEEKLPLRGSDCECEADKKKQERQAATQPPTVPPLSPNAILALQGVDAEELAAAKEDPNGKDGQALAQGQTDGQDPANGSEDASGSGVAGDGGQGAGNPAAAGQSGEDDGANKSDGLSEAEEKQVEKLKQRDSEVRAHEHAHARTGGAYAGAPSYSYQQGPDGKRYAIGGEVSIDTSGERTAEATIRKMQVVIRAATAPADPSSQDLKVAQQARAQLQEAQTQLRQERAAEQSGGDEAANGQETSGPASAGNGISGSEGSSNQNGANQNGSNGGGDNRGGIAGANSGSGSGRGEGSSSSATRAYSDALQLVQQANEDRAASRLNGLY